MNVSFRKLVYWDVHYLDEASRSALVGLENTPTDSMKRFRFMTGNLGLSTSILPEPQSLAEGRLLH